jgi:glycine hydroxymethyltransferase
MVLCDEEYADDLDKAVFPGGQGGPLMHNIAGKAVGFGEALEPEFEEYAEQTVANAKALGEHLQEHGFELVSGGTDNHLVLVDLRPSHPDTSGGDAEEALEDAGLVLNGNTVPGETRSPFDPSGIRVGTPAITTRGFEEDEAETVGHLIAQVVDAVAEGNEDEVVPEVREEVESLCEQYPIYE